VSHGYGRIPGRLSSARQQVKAIGTTLMLDIDRDVRRSLARCRSSVDSPREDSCARIPRRSQSTSRRAVEASLDPTKDLDLGPLIDLPEISQDRKGDPAPLKCRDEKSRTGCQPAAVSAKASRRLVALDLESDRAWSAQRKPTRNGRTMCDAGRVSGDVTPG